MAKHAMRLAPVEDIAETAEAPTDTPPPTKRGRKPRGPNKPKVGVSEVLSPPKLVAAPVALDEPPVRLHRVPAALAMIAPGEGKFISGALPQEVLDAASETGIGNQVWVQPHTHDGVEGVYVWRDA